MDIGGSHKYPGSNVIYGTIAESIADGGLRVEIDIRGPNVVITSAGDRWAVTAERVSLEALSPNVFRLGFGDAEFVFRPENPLQVRFAMERDLAMAARRAHRRSRRRPRDRADRDLAHPAGKTVWVAHNVEVEAIRPAPEPEPASVPARPVWSSVGVPAGPAQRRQGPEAVTNERRRSP